MNLDDVDDEGDDYSRVRSALDQLEAEIKKLPDSELSITHLFKFIAYLKADEKIFELIDEAVRENPGDVLHNLTRSIQSIDYEGAPAKFSIQLTDENIDGRPSAGCIITGGVNEIDINVNLSTTMFNARRFVRSVYIGYIPEDDEYRVQVLTPYLNGVGSAFTDLCNRDPRLGGW